LEKVDPQREIEIGQEFPEKVAFWQLTGSSAGLFY
jgi:hypothetical protein